MGRFFFQRRTKEKLAVIFDIGSASVGAALVGFSKDDFPKIFYATRHTMAVSKELHPDTLRAEMLTALRSVAENVEREGFPHVRFTFFSALQPIYTLFVLASPWHVSQVRVMRKKNAKPFYVGRELVRDLIFKELNEFRALRTTPLPAEQKNNSQEIIEADILDIRLNKYQTQDPLGKMTHDLEMTLFASSAERSLVEKITSAGHMLFPHAEHHFASFTFAFFNAVRDIWHEKRHYLLLDISGEVSDLSIVKDGRLLDTASFPIGMNTIIRRVALSLNISVHEAESLLAMHMRNHLGSAEAGRVQAILVDAEIEWLRFFSKELSGISSQILIPRDIFLTADDPLKSWFQNILSGNSFSRYAPTGNPFVVTALDEETLGRYCDIGAETRADPFLIVESLFFNKKINVV